MSDLLEKISAFADRAGRLEQSLGDPAVAANPGEYSRIAKELAGLRRAAEAATAYRAVLREIEDARGMLEDSDAEVRELAGAELEALEARRETLEQEIRQLLIPRDPNDEKNAIVEIRAGTGGD